MFQFLYRFKRRGKPTYKPVILVTGCASGIGLALAEMLYASDSYRVIVTAREKSLERLFAKFKESDRFWIRGLDLLKEEERVRVVREIEATFGSVNILVNNAGISYRSVIEHMTEADEWRQISTNYMGPIGLIREVLPRMREVGRGKIINVSSVSGMLAMPTMASYSASKYALEGASEALWYETKPLGINVSLVQPGFIHSKSFERVYYTEKSRPDGDPNGPYQDYYKNMAPFVEKLMHLSRTTPEKVAKTVMQVIRTEDPPLWIPATPDAVIFYYIRRMLPRRLLLPILFFMLPGARGWAKAYSKKRTN